MWVQLQVMTLFVLILQATLPNRIIRIRREKPIPEKVEAKWEKFARKKGIKKHKKERMVYDKNAKEWTPRWGYKVVIESYVDFQKAGTDSMDDWITEDKQFVHLSLRLFLKQFTPNTSLYSLSVALLIVSNPETDRPLP